MRKPRTIKEANEWLRRCGVYENENCYLYKFAKADSILDSPYAGIEDNYLNSYEKRLRAKVKLVKNNINGTSTVLTGANLNEAMENADRWYTLPIVKDWEDKPRKTTIFKRRVM